MTTSLTLRNITVATASGLLGALSLSSIAQAVTDTIFKYTNPKNGYYSIHPMAMAPDGTFTAGAYINSYNSGTVTGSGCFGTGVNLPQGATMTGLTVWFRSNSGSDP